MVFCHCVSATTFFVSLFIRFLSHLDNFYHALKRYSIIRVCMREYTPPNIDIDIERGYSAMSTHSTILALGCTKFASWLCVALHLASMSRLVWSIMEVGARLIARSMPSTVWLCHLGWQGRSVLRASFPPCDLTSDRHFNSFDIVQNFELAHWHHPSMIRHSILHLQVVPQPPNQSSRVESRLRSGTTHKAETWRKDETHTKKNTGRKVPNKRNTANPFDLPVS